MTIHLFEYSSYRPYLKARLEANGPKSGLKRRAAESLSVHTTFISQVVLGKADLSLDQGERMNHFLKHSDEESDYFLDLLIYERASEASLKKRYEKKIHGRHQQRAQIHRRFEKTRELAPADQKLFYSSHLFGLLHVLASIPQYRDRESLALATGFPQRIVNDAIDFLLRIGVLKSVKGQLIPGERHLHLGNDSSHIWQHHANWRMASLQRMQFGQPTDLHYSLSFSCSEKDAVKMRESLLEHLKSMSETIARSPEEKAYVYCFDLYEWT
jgi:uncharacterized protein (TIGR02147 family)